MSRPAYYNEIDPFCCAWLRQAITDGLLPAGDVDERDIRLVQPPELEGYGQIHFFAGIGGGALACRIAGVPDDFHIITAGVPCQPASVAGSRLGESDERWLWPDFLRLLGDRVLRDHYALAENPPGILTLADGSAFAGILAKLAEIGRDAEWANISAADVGASHERERIWIVAYPAASRRGSETWPEREAGLTGMVHRKGQNDGVRTSALDVGFNKDKHVRNHHPTVKPLALMRWLCRLVTPGGGLILDPFAGSGSTGCAAVLEGFRFVGIEREAEYADIASARIAHHAALYQPDLSPAVGE